MKQFQLLFLFLAFFSCGQKSATTESPVPAPAIQYTGGKTYNENNYSLYLPANYDTTKTFPVIYFFDPQGKGNLPLEKYKSIADTLGIIFVGSTATKKDWETNWEIPLKDSWILQTVN